MVVAKARGEKIAVASPVRVHRFMRQACAGWRGMAREKVLSREWQSLFWTGREARIRVWGLYAYF